MKRGTKISLLFLFQNPLQDCFTLTALLKSRLLSICICSDADVSNQLKYNQLMD
jgi:hypothetical protein